MGSIALLAGGCLLQSRWFAVEAKTVAYSRVSSHDQKKDLERQQEILSLYCASRGWQYEIISDLGSGMNYRKKGLRQLLALIVSGQVERLVITHKDRLLRFGAELVFAMCETRDCEVVIINQGDQPSFEGAGQPEELAQDVLDCWQRRGCVRERSRLFSTLTQPSRFNFGLSARFRHVNRQQHCLAGVLCKMLRFR